MLAKKNRICAQILIAVTLTVVMAGCAPPGPGALLKGKKLMDRGDYAKAVSELKTATTLLATNAGAWDYYGVALQHAGELADAEAAYLNALHFDRDLVEAHYNLGCLYMEEEKYGEARTEFTAYTLRRSNTPEGWLKLGDAQLREGDDLLAERSYSTALSLSPDNAEALNGLGLARVQRGKTHDAAEFFGAAVQHHPDFGPAILNLATVEAEYLHDNNAALENYRKYLALTPPPEDTDAVNALVQKLEQMPSAVVSAPKPAPAENSASVSPAPAPEPRVSRRKRLPQTQNGARIHHRSRGGIFRIRRPKWCGWRRSRKWRRRGNRARPKRLRRRANRGGWGIGSTRRKGLIPRRRRRLTPTAG